MDNATPNHPNKRVRINENNNEIVSILRTPSKQSNNAFSSFAVSLLPAISSLAMHYHRRYTKLKVTALQQSLKTEKLSNDEFVPRSASFHFKLGATQRLEESEEFKSLAESTTTKIKTLQNDLKANILQASKLENELLLKDTMTLYCEAANKLGTISLLAQTKQTTVSAEAIDKFVLYSVAKEQRSLHYINAGMFDDFVTTYTRHYPNNYNIVFENNTPAVATRPTTTRATTRVLTGAEASAAFAEHLSQLERDSDTSDMEAETTTRTNTDTIHVRNVPNYTNTFSHTTVTNFGNLLYQLFTASWAAYIVEHDNKLLNIKLQKFAKSTMETKATDNAARLLNSEATVDPQTLQDLIRQNVAKETQELRATVQKLQQQAKRPAKNSSRGDKLKSRASPKKKSKITKPTKNTSKRQQTPSKRTPKKNHATTQSQSKANRKKDSADASAQDTPAVKRKTQKKKSASKTNGTKGKKQHKST
jgi:hypothetical protein